jgi:hypothetical protein
MSGEMRKTVQELLLTRRGIVFVDSEGSLSTRQVDAVALELAAFGYVMSSRLSERLLRCSLKELAKFRTWAMDTLRTHLGGNVEHEPLFRRFPEGIPDDTLELWSKKVLVHFEQSDGQICLFCRQTGTTHVLSPCRHVVCDHCFDGSTYSACPICEHHVDRSSPFFGELTEREPSTERTIFKLLDLGVDRDGEARAFFVALCERKQALSPVDRDALVAILHEYKEAALPWLPAEIPLRENVAVVFGSLFRLCSPSEVMPIAIRFMASATDVLRFIAVLSGTDGSLLGEVVDTDSEWAVPFRCTERVGTFPGETRPVPVQRRVAVSKRIYRFRMAKLSRPLRRALLGVLESMDAELLVEDMLRHRSYWVWVGQFLHPHEYASSSPKVARAFEVIRSKSPDGTPAPSFQTWNARLELAVRAKDHDAMLSVLGERPGEFARHLDHALRAADGDAIRDRIASAFAKRLRALSTPVLLTLRSHLPARTERAAVRVFWPKSRFATGVSRADERVLLSSKSIEPLVAAIDAELLRRFATKPAFQSCMIDTELRTIVAPFNERTASRSAVSLPRGSRVTVPESKIVRMFLHWCEPEEAGESTDLDLSIGLYDSSWQAVGVCSYYQLKAVGKDGSLLAQSAGDLRDAPWPNGATEFVDLRCKEALANGVRYAVMVVNAYAGMPFNRLERGFAGVMLRDDPGGLHFDPRTVELKFALDGENGVFLPLVLDLQTRELHWLDVVAKGQLEMNNVETSSGAITKLCPELMTYFASGVRPTMFDIALLHAAARCDRVQLRGKAAMTFVRKPDEDAASFHARLVRQEADAYSSERPSGDGPPVLAMLYRGNLGLPAGSEAYVLFRDLVVPSLSASDLIC